MAEPETIPPHPLLRRVPPAALEGRTCAICHLAFDGRRSFVEALVPENAEPAVSPGMTLTKEDQPGRTITRHRDPWAPGGESFTTEIRNIYCSDCVTAAAQQLGIPPASQVLQVQAAEARERAEKAERERDDAVRELEERSRGFAVTRSLTKLLEAEREAATTTRKPRKRQEATA